MTAQLLNEKYLEKHRLLYVAFLDLEKAFDLVPQNLSGMLCSNTYARRAHALCCAIRKINLNKTKFLLADP